VNPKVIAFSSLTTKVEITSGTSTAGWNDFFDNYAPEEHDKGCAITSCTLWQGGACGTTGLDATATTYFVVDAAVSIPSYHSTIKVS
jgi:hypothetical protein